MRVGETLYLVDWDTVALAPPERDLCMVGSESGDELDLYFDRTGRAVDRAAMSLYGTRWPLDDIALVVRMFRSTHAATDDTELAWLALTRHLEDLDSGCSR